MSVSPIGRSGGSGEAVRAQAFPRTRGLRLRYASTLRGAERHAHGAWTIHCGAMPSRTPYSPTMDDRIAKFRIGQVVRHRVHPFRGVIFDVDPVFSNTDEWWEAIPEHLRPRKDQPFYHLLAENETTAYIAYVSEQNLLVDESGEPVQHPQIDTLFGELQGGQYVILEQLVH